MLPTGRSVLPSSCPKIHECCHTSGCHTESSEGKKEWSRHPLKQVLRKEERLGGKASHISQSQRQGVHSSFPEAFLLLLPQNLQQ